MIPIPNAMWQWRGMFESNAALRPPLTWQELFCVCWGESSGNEKAVNPRPPAAAKDRGLFQLEMPEALAYSEGEVATPDDLFVAQHSCAAASRYLAYLKLKYAPENPLLRTDGTPNPRGWIGIYNMGETAFHRGATDLAYVKGFLDRMASLQAYLVAQLNDGAGSAANQTQGEA